MCVTRTPIASSTTFFSALVTNEVLRTVTFDTSLGVRIKLSNASVASYKLFEERDQEEICFTFASIELTMRGGVTATDSWGQATR